MWVEIMSVFEYLRFPSARPINMWIDTGRAQTPDDVASINRIPAGLI
jgi:hypothetical protein